MSFLKSSFLVLLLSQTAAAVEPVVNITTMNQKLQSENAPWFAKETWITKLSKDEAKKMMGAKGLLSDDVEFGAADDVSSLSLPSKVDWRNQASKNWVPPIRNQANCGSCVAFASVAVMETQLNIASGFPGMNVRLSPQHLFSCGGGMCDDGWWPQGAIDFLQTNGVTDESCMPYASGATSKDVACSAKCADAAKRTFKISDYGTPSKFFMHLTKIKEALQHGPLLATLKIYDDFIGYAGGVYSKSKTAQYLGGHAISIVGYDDSKQAFIIRNSWGEEWGEKGFGYVAYDNGASLGRQTWWINVASQKNSVAMVYPREYDYVSGTQKFSAKSGNAQADSLQFTLVDKNKKAVWSGTCQGNDCGVSVDSTTLADGTYEIQSTALNTHGQKVAASTKQMFYIVNKKPELKLSFTGMPGVDLTKPVSDRIDLAITTKSSSVPMNFVEFHYRNSAGKELVKTADQTLEKMTMGWRTTIIANGTYEIWMVGRVKTKAIDASVETPHYSVKVKNEVYR